MACNTCETQFQGSQTLGVTVTKVGANVTLYLHNQGKNVVLIRRIRLCLAFAGGAITTMFLRAAPEGITWTYPLTYLEPGISALYFTLTAVTKGTIVQAQAEYIEIEGRSRSCSVTA